MPEHKRPLRRGEIMGEVVSPKPASEADCFIRCPACVGWIDIRDLGQIMEPAGPLPHPVQDQPQ